MKVDPLYISTYLTACDQAYISHPLSANTATLRLKIVFCWQAVMKISMPPGLGTDNPFHQQQATTDVWDAGPDQFAQEPIFCPRPDAQTEDDGWLLSMVYDSLSDTTQLVVLDAQDLQKGPIARIKLPHRIPYGKLSMMFALSLRPV